MTCASGRSLPHLYRRYANTDGTDLSMSGEMVGEDIIPTYIRQFEHGQPGTVTGK